MNPTTNSQQSNTSLPPVNQQKEAVLAPQAPVVPLATVPPNQTAPQTPAVSLAAPVNPAMSAVNGTTIKTASSTADDSDLIEKEWVERAKHIVEGTLDNPYERSRELTALKAEYMKTRYGRDVKQSE